MNHSVPGAADPVIEPTNRLGSSIRHWLIIAVLIALIGLTLFASAQSVRFEVAAQGLASLTNGAPAPTDPPLPSRGHLI